MKKEKKLSELKERIKSLKEQNKKFEAGWKRALADYQNLEKRFEEEKKHITKYANIDLILDLLSVLDNLEEASKHIKDSGLSLCVRQFREVLKNNGVEVLEVENSKFDPKIMEAVDVAEGEENKVLKVLKRGYRMGERILRPAKVVVGGKKWQK